MSIFTLHDRSVVAARGVLAERLDPPGMADAVCAAAGAIADGTGEALERSLTGELARTMPEVSALDRRKLIVALFIVARAQCDA